MSDERRCVIDTQVRLSWSGALPDHFLSEKERERPVSGYQAFSRLRTTLCDSCVFYSFPVYNFGAGSTILLDTNFDTLTHSLPPKKVVDYKIRFFQKYLKPVVLTPYTFSFAFAFILISC